MEDCNENDGLILSLHSALTDRETITELTEVLSSRRAVEPNLQAVWSHYAVLSPVTKVKQMEFKWVIMSFQNPYTFLSHSPCSDHHPNSVL
jgi:hypothetical protein